jgi:CHAD domain-containing protein
MLLLEQGAHELDADLDLGFRHHVGHGVCLHAFAVLLIVVFSDDRALVQVRLAFAGYLETIDANLHAANAEALHDLRVAIRRTRALLANAKGVVRERDRVRFALGFGGLGRATTLARDLDVAIADWPRTCALVDEATAADLGPIYDALCQRRDAARAAVTATLESSATRQLVDDWHAWLAAPPDFRAGRARKSAKKTNRRRAHKVRRRLLHLAASNTPEARHAWRKGAKRLRYLAEGFPAVARPKLVRRLTQAQDELGRGRDRLMQAGIVEAIASEPEVPEHTKHAAAVLADALRRAAAVRDKRREVSRSLKRWIRAA